MFYTNLMFDRGGVLDGEITSVLDKGDLLLSEIDEDSKNCIFIDYKLLNNSSR